jgi:2-(1,2-epoxy-1,2-dihydrophenyl)acetyl-CoA isomerase
MDFQKLDFVMDGGVATLTLNRPDVANAMDLDMSKELMHAAIRCDEDATIRAVVITGAGRFFSAGGDLEGFRAAGDDVASLLKEMTVYLHAAISRFARMDAPVVAAVNGMAAGAGFSLMGACDITIAAESARFTSAYTAASLSPDGSSTYFIPRLIGRRRAMELMLTNRRLSAAEALEWGLINEVVPDDELVGRAAEVAKELAGGATLAFGKVKDLLNATFSESLETQMEREARAIADLTHSEDGREGIAAFLEKRAPEYRGR